MKSLFDYIDEKGCLFQKESAVDSRFGDSSQKTFMLDVMDFVSDVTDITSFRKEVERKSAILTIDGIPVRHWDVRYWPARKDLMSRDNLFTRICAQTLADSSFRFQTLSLIFKRFGFLWNTRDIGGHPKKAKIFGLTIPFPFPDFSGPLMWLIAFKWAHLACIYIKAPIFFHLLKTEKDHDETTDDPNLFTALVTLDKLTEKAPAKTRAKFEEARDYYCNNRTWCINGNHTMRGYIQALQNFFYIDEAPPLDVEAINVARKLCWKVSLQ